MRLIETWLADPERAFDLFEIPGGRDGIREPGGWHGP